MPRPIRVWDLPLRLFHWLLVTGILVAFVTAGRPPWLHLHVFAGTVVGGLLAFRLLWGILGSRHARLGALLRPLSEVRGQLRGLRDGTARRHLGHNPLAAWAMIAVLLLLTAVVGTGVLLLGGEEQQGPLAGWLDVPGGALLHEPHEILAWMIPIWLVLHLSGVVKESSRTRENLVLSMLHGKKRPEPGESGVRAHAGVAALMMMGVLASAFAWLPELRALAGEEEPPLPFVGPVLPQDPLYDEACGECHLAFHPSLLPRRSWEALMAGSADHFGEDLALDAETASRVRAFLVENAAETAPAEAAWRIASSIPAGEAPLRLTETIAWKRFHEEISKQTFEAEPVRSPLRCEACHRDAEAGTFNDSAMGIPALEEAR